MYTLQCSVAKKIVSAQATSAQRERDFSQASLIGTSRRAQVSAEKG